MSAYCALHIKTVEVQPILAVLEKWLQETLGGVTVGGPLSEFPSRFYEDFFGDELWPSTFLLEQVPPGWITVHYNSFHELTELAERMSAECSALVISVMAESVTETYILQVAEKGNILRILYYSGESGEWIRQEGKPFPFESEPLGTNISDDPSEPFYVFGREDTIEYCRNLGLELWGEQEADKWWLIAGPREGRGGDSAATPSTPAQSENRPWWKFW